MKSLKADAAPAAIDIPPGVADFPWGLSSAVRMQLLKNCITSVCEGLLPKRPIGLRPTSRVQKEILGSSIVIRPKAGWGRGGVFLLLPEGRLHGIVGHQFLVNGLGVLKIDRSVRLKVDLKQPSHSNYEDKDYPKLVSHIQADKDRKFGKSSILICWHHGEILNLAGALGASSKTLPSTSNWPLKWPKKVYGIYWYLESVR